MTDTLTVTRAPWVAGVVKAKVAELNARIAAKGLGEPVTLTVSEVKLPSDAAVAAYYGALGLVDPRTPVAPPPGPTVDITITTAPVVLPGNWVLAGVLDFETADTPIVHNLIDDIDLRDGVIDPLRCDACGVARHRNRTFAVRSSDGETVVVGSTCVRDFLGIDPGTLLWVSEVVGEVADEDEFFSGSFGSADIPTLDFVAAARAAVVTAGWVKASDWDSTPTKSFASDIVAGRIPGKDDGLLVDAREVYVDPATWAYAKAAIEWAAGIDASSDFDFNLVAVATSETLGTRGYGIAAYLPVAYARHLDAEAFKAAEAKAKDAGEVEPVPEGRVTVSGEVISLATRESAYGVVEKMTVRDDRGFRVWVTVPSAISAVPVGGGWRELARGDRVTFDATLTPSDDDEFFGFGKRPTKASVIDAEAAAA